MVHEIVPPQVQHFELLWLNFQRFLLDHFSSLSRSFFMAAEPSDVGVTPPTLLLRAHSGLSSRSFTKKVKQIGIWYSSMSYITSHETPIRLWITITTLWAWLHCQFSILCCLPIQSIHQQLLYEAIIGDSIKRLAEVFNIYCSSLIYWPVISS